MEVDRNNWRAIGLWLGPDWHDNDDDDDDGEEDDEEEEVVMVLDAYGHATSRWALEWGFIEGMLMAESNVYCWG